MYVKSEGGQVAVMSEVSSAWDKPTEEHAQLLFASCFLHVGDFLCGVRCCWSSPPDPLLTQWRSNSSRSGNNDLLRWQASRLFLPFAARSGRPQIIPPQTFHSFSEPPILLPEHRRDGEDRELPPPPSQSESVINRINLSVTTTRTLKFIHTGSCSVRHQPKNWSQSSWSPINNAPITKQVSHWWCQMSYILNYQKHATCHMKLIHQSQQSSNFTIKSIQTQYCWQIYKVKAQLDSSYCQDFHSKSQL